MIRKRLCAGGMLAILLFGGLGMANIRANSQAVEVNDGSIHSEFNESLKKEIKNVDFSKIDINSTEVKEGDQVADEGGDKEFTYYKIPLSKELQTYIYKTCKENEINDKRIWSIIYHETGGTFDKDLLSSTNDKGLMQINRINWNYWKDCGLDVVGNPKDNILAGILTYKYSIDYWSEQGYTGDELVKISLLTYNRGKVGAIRYKNKYGLDHEYNEKILEIYNNFDKYFVEK